VKSNEVKMYVGLVGEICFTDPDLSGQAVLLNQMSRWDEYTAEKWTGT
jgi:hypothetical protein